MKVRTRLGVAIALPVVLLGAMLAYHILTTRAAVEAAHELTALWARVHRTAIEQQGRLAQLEESAAKYLVTRDPGYLDKLRELAGAFDVDLRLLQDLPLGGREQDDIAALAAAWAAFAPLPDRLAGPLPPRELDLAFEALRHRTTRVSQASQAAMVARLARSRQAAREVERASIVVAGIALILSGVVVLLVVRSIARPISRLAEGTLEIGHGRFDYRLDDRRDDEFARVATEFNRMAQRLGDVDRTQRDFVANVSHDLKTPLASMRETTALLLEEVPGPLTETQRHLLQLHQDNGRRLGRMLGQLLDLSRLDACPAPVIQPVLAAGLIRQAAEQAGGTGSFPWHGIEVHLPDEPVWLACDPDRLRQVLDNLLDNALKFSPAGSPVVVEAKVLPGRPRWIPAWRWGQVRRDSGADGVLFLAVADQGPGIPDAEKNLVFSRFHRVPGRGGARGGGVGLGLTICREIVHAHGGTIWVADNPGGGSAFRMLLPGVYHGAGAAASEHAVTVGAAS